MSPENAFKGVLIGSHLFVIRITKLAFDFRDSSEAAFVVIILPLGWVTRLTPLGEYRAQRFESPWVQYGLGTELNNRGNKWRSEKRCFCRARAEMTSRGENWIAWPSRGKYWLLTLVTEKVIAGSRCNALVAGVAVQQFIDALEDVLHGHAPSSIYRGVANR